MHGLVNRSIQRFIRDTYGKEAWDAVAAEAGVASEGFEALLSYENALTDAVIDSASKRFAKPRGELLEDLGIHLAGIEALRRLLRFGGVDFADFILSLDELPDRARLAVPELDLPEVSVHPVGGGRFRVICRGDNPGYGPVFAGILRAIADDYGALALIDLDAPAGRVEAISVELLDARFATGRQFHLARPDI
ncbi:MAG: heme NO-binding domain-containing protein [Paracoccaceae bacterium]